MIGHPLFPLVEDEDEKDIGWIYLIRAEATGPVWCPNHYKAEDMLDLSTISDLYGGGRYELVAREPTKRKIIARVSYVLPGPSKPLGGLGQQPEAPANGQPSLAMPAPTSSDPMAIMLPIMMQMMQLQSQQSTAQMNQTMQMVTALISGGSTNAQQHIASMQQLHDRHAESQAQLFQAIVASKGEAGGKGDFMKGMEFMKSFMQDNLPQALVNKEDDASILQTINDLVQGASMFMHMKTGDTPPNSPLPPTQSSEPPHATE